jgi:ADP-heptose:LPS heptosyltransferase
MSRRRRWTPIKGTRNRIYDPLERWLTASIDAPAHLAFGLARGLGLARQPPAFEAPAVREVLVLRLDRIGDLLMSFPALERLRAAFPDAHIRLAVGRWSEPIARRAPVDEVLVWNAPWVGRKAEGGEGFGSLRRKARALKSKPLDLAIDLQGDVRAAVLMWLTGARWRVGYANTGGGYLLTHVVPLDETVSWLEQNQLAVTSVIGTGRHAAPIPLVTEQERGFCRRLFADLGLATARPLIGIHPSGGRRVKQWDPRRWGQVGARLQRELNATILITGSAADRALAADVAAELDERRCDLTGRLSLRETLSVIAGLDLFLSPDTGPMHMACRLGTPSVSVFGPSDPIRYFSGAEPETAGVRRHVVVRRELWCSPCNRIRRPPKECAGPQPPDCLAAVSVDEVHAAAQELLVQTGPARGADRA